MLNLITSLQGKYKKVQADYYISALTGNDNNSGTSYLYPFKTLAPLNELSSVEKRGKVFAFERGGIYEGTFQIYNILNTSYPTITITSYGKGNNPLFSCKKQITGWTNEGGNIWSVTDEDFPSKIKNVWKDNDLLTIGRYPKTGYNFVTYTDEYIIRDSSETHADDYWNGGTLNYMYYSWAQNNVIIKEYNQSGGEFIWENQLNYASQVGYGYFITHHVNCLTEENEWAYDPTNKKLYLYSSTTPASIYVSYFENSIEITNVNNFSISEIDFEYSADIQIKLRECNNFTIRDCNFERSGNDCINVYKCHDYTIDGCYSNNAQNHFFRNSWFNEYSYPFTNQADDSNYNIVISNNIIENTGLEEEKVGETYPSSASAICAWKLRDAEIYNNTIINTGYIPIKWTCSGNVEIYHNYVDNYCLIHSDGGGIYTWGNNETVNAGYNVSKHGGSVHNNIVVNALNGDFSEKIGNGYNTSVGLYVDDNSHDIEVYENFTSGAWINSKNGTAVRRITIENNTFVINGVGADSAINFVAQVAENTVNDNLIVVWNYDNQKLNSFTTNDPFEDGFITDNKHYFPFANLSPNDEFFRWDVAALTWDEFILLDFEAVGTEFSGDSVIEPSLFENSSKPYNNYVYVITNPSLNPLVIPEGDLPYDDYIDMDGVAFGTSRTIEPFGSLILVREE